MNLKPTLKQYKNCTYYLFRNGVKKTINNVQDQNKSFLNFDNMITPKIIQIIFYIGLAITLVIGLVMILGGESLFGGLVVILVEPLLIRVNCELIIVVFKIHEVLQDIRYR